MFCKCLPGWTRCPLGSSRHKGSLSTRKGTEAQRRLYFPQSVTVQVDRHTCSIFSLENAHQFKKKRKKKYVIDAEISEPGSVNVHKSVHVLARKNVLISY